MNKDQAAKGAPRELYVDAEGWGDPDTDYVESYDAYINRPDFPTILFREVIAPESPGIESAEKTAMHDDLRIAIERNDYDKICQFLHTRLYPADSEWTTTRCNDSFIQGWKECQKIYANPRSETENTENGLVELQNAFAKEVGAKVRSRRLELGMSKAQLATLTRCAISEISEIESGRRHISVELGQCLAKALTKDYEWILGDANPRSEPLDASSKNTRSSGLFDEAAVLKFAKLQRFKDDCMHKANGSKSEYDELVRGIQVGAQWQHGETLRSDVVMTLRNEMKRIAENHGMYDVGHLETIAEKALAAFDRMSKDGE